MITGREKGLCFLVWGGMNKSHLKDLSSQAKELGLCAGAKEYFK